MQDSIENLIYFVVKKLVLSPESVTVEKQFNYHDRAVHYRVKVADDDMPRVIGKQGRIAKSIRNIVKSVALKNNIKVLLDIG